MEPKRFDIAVDWDGTVIRHADAVLTQLAKTHGLKITAYQILTWDWFEDWGISEADFWEACEAANENHETIMPYDELTIPVLRAMAEHHNVSILTSRRLSMYASVDRWLTANDLQIPIVNTGNQIDPVAGKMSQPFDIIIDDNPLLALEMMETGGDRDAGLHICPTTPWNRYVRQVAAERQAALPSNLIHHSNVVFADSWAQIALLIDERSISG